MNKPLSVSILPLRKLCQPPLHPFLPQPFPNLIGNNIHFDIFRPIPPQRSRDLNLDEGENADGQVGGWDWWRN